MARSALESVAEAVYTALNVSTLTTIATSGVFSHVPQGTEAPFVWFTVSERDVDGTFAQVFKECLIRVHAYSGYEGEQEAQQMINAAVSLLRDTTPSVDHHTAVMLRHEDSSSFGTETINGKPIVHLAADFRLTVAEN